MTRDDGVIKRDVEDELRGDPEIDIQDIIGVSVKDGIVTLTGFVRRFDDRLEAEAAAKRVAGVIGVVNDLELRIPGEDQRPDPDIARDAAVMIENALGHAAANIRVVVDDGYVTLEGEVEGYRQRETAENIVSHLKGVRDVSNLLRLKSSVEPGDIRRAIQAALRRNAEIDADRIIPEVDGSEVILRGTAKSWVERREAELAAWRAPGVTKVDNRIDVAA